MIKVKLTKLTNLKQHLLYWCVYAVYFYVVNVLGNDQMTVGLVALSLPYFAFVFYSVLYILQRFLSVRQYLECILSLGLFYSISSVSVWLLTHANWEISLLYGAYLVSDYTFSWQEFVQTLLVMHCQFSILAFVYFHYLGKLTEERQKVTEMEKRLVAEEEKQRYEYAALAAQVSPHMMANIFQSWSRQLAHTSSVIARQMMNVYGLMKFYMQAHEADSSMTILLQDEIRAVQRFMDAQQDILGRVFFVDWQVQGNLYRFGIPPTSLLTLVKNAFKHGDIYSEDRPLCIAVDVAWSHYTVQVRNRKSDSGPVLHSHGQGLLNLKRRLHLVFGRRARLEIEDTGRDYRVELHVDYKI